MRFFITVKKNYRQVAYHNWSHGFHVANSIYCMIKHVPDQFTMLEVIYKYKELNLNSVVQLVLFDIQSCIFYERDFDFSVWQCSLELFVMILTTVDSTISLWLILGLHWLLFTPHQPWRIIILTWQSLFFSRYLSIKIQINSLSGKKLLITKGINKEQ